MRPLVPLLAALLTPAVAMAQVYQAPYPEPTPEEVEILEHMNRFRADPSADADRIAPGGVRPRGVPATVDIAMFIREMREIPAAPPLVFDLQALDSARKHSFYMVHNGLGHNQQEGKTGFTGRSFSDRMRAAGFKGSPGGENCFAQARDPWFSHVGFIVDWSNSPADGGMQSGRGHRMNMARSRFNVVGASAVPNGSAISVTHNFGSKRGRFAGGVIFTDRNGNNFFDAGEGRGGVTIIASDGSQTTTWASGGYTLPLEGNGEVTIRAQLGDMAWEETFSAGSDNVRFAWMIPPEEDLRAADRLLTDIAAIGEDDRSRPGALVDLYVRTRGLMLDPERQSQIDSLTAEAGPALEAAKTAVLDAIAASDDRAVRDALRAGRDYRRTLAESWFAEAKALADATKGVNGYLAAQEADPSKVTDRLVRRLRDGLESARDAATNTDMRSAFAALLSQVRDPDANQRGNGRRR